VVGGSPSSCSSSLLLPLPPSSLTKFLWKHRHIVEVGLSLLARAHMPLKFWDEAFLTTKYLINRTPSKILEYATLIDHLFRISPDYRSL
jgi:hypothetical protein